MVALKGDSDNSDIYECQGDDDREHVALDDDGNDVGVQNTPQRQDYLLQLILTLLEGSLGHQPFDRQQTGITPEVIQFVVNFSFY